MGTSHHHTPCTRMERHQIPGCPSHHTPGHQDATHHASHSKAQAVGSQALSNWEQWTTTHHAPGWSDIRFQDAPVNTSTRTPGRHAPRITEQATGSRATGTFVVLSASCIPPGRLRKGEESKGTKDSSCIFVDFGTSLVGAF